MQMENELSQQRKWESSFLMGAIFLMVLSLARPAFSNVGILGSWATGTSHTKETGNNRALIFIAHNAYSSGFINPMDMNSVTYGGQPMTKIIEKNYTEDDFAGRAYVVAYVLNEAGVAAATDNNFVPTWVATPSAVKYASVFLKNVEQTTPVGDRDSDGTTAATVVTPSLDTYNGDMTILAATCGKSGSYTLGSGFTEGTDQSISTKLTGVTGHKAATGAAEVPSATFSTTANRQAMIGFVVQTMPDVNKSSNPTPVNGARNIDVNTTISWTPGEGATSHDVYFGTDPCAHNNPKHTVDTNSYDPPGDLEYGTTYYWAVDSNKNGTIYPGTDWRFATVREVDPNYVVGTWAAGQQLTETSNNPPNPPGLTNNTLRQVVHATLGGSKIRVQFSNKYSSGPVTINSAHIAASAGGSAINTATDTALLFWGAPSVTIDAGEEVYSDAVDFNVAPLSNLTVSIYFGSASSTNVTGHPGSRTTSYLQSGNLVSAASMPSATTTDHWYILSRIDLLLDDSYGCVVTLGNSITDGRGSTTNGDNRWPDNLAARLNADPNTAKVGVINQGIGGNAVVSGGLGPTALVRFDHDVVNQPGARWVIILEGVNDIGGGQTAANLIAAYQQFINKAHANNILIYGIPILPFGGSSYDSPAHRTVRDTVNNWIRTSGQFDAVIDLDPVVCDPADPNKLLPAYLYQNDYLHLNVAGYQAMANAINLDLFKKAADLNKDGIVNFVDFVVLAGQWLQEPGLPSADIAPPGGDEVVDFEDLYLMAQEWLIG